MLNRVLTVLLEKESLDEVSMIDDMGRLLSSVTRAGRLPAADAHVALLIDALEAQQRMGLGDLHEVWVEGNDRTLIDIVTPHRILIAQGREGRLGRWRHSVDHLRSALATTPSKEVTVDV
ncbi:MAG: hypothetical protein DWC07_07180 [Candidatus Poseidoniales archaeon]|nr:MAG: hypothetical protein DWC07_07180 [Candidatus Poseidoniales archaeon]